MVTASGWKSKREKSKSSTRILFDLEQLVRQYVPLGRIQRGFYQVKCAKCHDYKERGGFKLENGSVGYFCFNCSTKARYDPEDKKRVSRELRDVLVAFGVPSDEITRAEGAAHLRSSDEPPKELKLQKKILELPSQDLKLPPKTYSVTSDDSPWCEVAREYLNGRKLTHSGFFYSDDPAWFCRLIIPYYFQGRLIYYQGRAMDELIVPRYKNPTVERENIFFNMDEVYRYTTEPLYVTEGPLDALSLGSTAVATLGSVLGDFRIRELQRASKHRKIIFVIDKNVPGYKLGKQVLDLGWNVICFPDNFSDANDALIKMGRLWTLNHVASAVSGAAGRLMLEMHCK